MAGKILLAVSTVSEEMGTGVWPRVVGQFPIAEGGEQHQSLVNLRLSPERQGGGEQYCKG